MEFGKTLRQAREAKGYTISQLAETTRVMSQVIEGLENENFKKIAAPIYGRGFVKLCCQALDLDPKPMIDEFMALYTGEKPTAVVQPIPPPAKPVEKPAEPEIRPAGPIGADEVPVQDPQRDLFEQPIATPPPPAAGLSRFAPPIPEDERNRTSFEMPAIPWRLVGLIITAIAVLWAIIAGGRALYRALGETDQKPAVSASAAPTAAAAGTAAKTPRTAKTVKPLYID